jgi:hypothetical protein
VAHFEKENARCLNQAASRALPGMARLSLATIALSFALLIAAFVLTVFTL